MQKIAILGGGIGALARAAELTNDPNWQKNYDITIYQMAPSRRVRASLSLFDDPFAGNQ